MEEKPIIVFENCTKKFGSKTVLADISFAINRSYSFVSILGRSGSGKTTLIRLMAGLETLSSGVILIDGKRVNQNERILIPPHQRNIGFIFQDVALWPHMTVFENIAFGLKLKKVSHWKTIVAEIMEQFHIEPLRNNYPNQLSGGQQQLVALARSFVLKPRILLMDEPLANLDVHLKWQIRALLKQMINETGTTIMYVTHDHKEALEVSDQIILLNNGKLEWFGTPGELIQSSNAFVKEFIKLS